MPVPALSLLQGTNRLKVAVTSGTVRLKAIRFPSTIFEVVIFLHVGVAEALADRGAGGFGLAAGHRIGA